MAEPSSGELVRHARKLLSTRTDAPIHLSRERAALEVSKAERLFWDFVVRTRGSRLSVEQLAAALTADGLSRDQASQWSHAIVTGQPNEAIELDPPEVCAHCGSDIRGKKECGVCGQPRGSRPEVEVDAAAVRARRVVRALVAGERLALVSANAEPAVVRVTARLLADEADSAPDVVAAALEAAWLELDEVEELFADAEEIAAALAER